METKEIRLSTSDKIAELYGRLGEIEYSVGILGKHLYNNDIQPEVEPEIYCMDRHIDACLDRAIRAAKSIAEIIQQLGVLQ